MYDDGPGSPNLDCGHRSSSGCWDHRQNILGNYGAHPSMGAAATMVDGVTSMTELFSSGAGGVLEFSLRATGLTSAQPLGPRAAAGPGLSRSPTGPSHRPLLWRRRARPSAWNGQSRVVGESAQVDPAPGRTHKRSQGAPFCLARR